MSEEIKTFSPIMGMLPCDEGDGYVSFSDYSALKAELEQAHTHNKQLLFDNHHLINRCNKAEDEVVEKDSQIKFLIEQVEELSREKTKWAEKAIGLEAVEGK